jgi:hypothetical protein
MTKAIWLNSRWQMQHCLFTTSLINAGRAQSVSLPMMAITHAAIAAAGVSLLFGTADPLPLGLAVLGSQLPDLDTTTSIIGQVLYPVSSWIEDRFPHRSVTHSLVATWRSPRSLCPSAYTAGNLPGSGGGAHWSCVGLLQ